MRLPPRRSRSEWSACHGRRGTTKQHTMSTILHVDGKSLLPDRVVLIPVARASKKPTRKGWPEIRFDETQTPEYRAELERGNVAVLLGPPSGGVVDIEPAR